MATARLKIIRETIRRLFLRSHQLRVRSLGNREIGFVR